jgi:hypothetical protein
MQAFFRERGCCLRVKARPNHPAGQQRIVYLEKKIQTTDEVLAELMAEHVALAKALGHSDRVLSPARSSCVGIASVQPSWVRRSLDPGNRHVHKGRSRLRVKPRNVEPIAFHRDRSPPNNAALGVGALKIVLPISTGQLRFAPLRFANPSPIRLGDESLTSKTAGHAQHAYRSRAGRRRIACNRSTTVMESSPYLELPRRTNSHAALKYSIPPLINHLTKNNR